MRPSCCHRIGAAVIAVLILPLIGVLAPTPSLAEAVIDYHGTQPPGTIVVRTGERRLYLVIGDGKALVYPVGVGKQGKQWAGQSRIVRKMLKPAWAAPPEVKHDIPGIPRYIRGGSRRNPLGAAALVLAGGEYAIHGTNRPESIGGFVSYGCIRMYNRDILALYRHVQVGTPVMVMR